MSVQRVNVKHAPQVDHRKMSEETRLGVETTWRSISSSEGASSSLKAEENPHFDFISTLARIVGERATAENRKPLINVQTNFTFKRFERRWEARSDADEPKEFQRVHSEVLVLGTA